MASEKGLIFSQSPYYIYETGSAGFTSNIELRIWNGSKSSVPTDYDILLEKQALTASSSYAVFEVGQILNSYTTNRYGVYDGVSGSNEGAKWVSIKSYNGTVNRDDLHLVTDGYSEFLEGINYSPTPNLLISQNVLYHYEDIPIRVPIFVSGSTNAVTVEYQKDGSPVYTEDLTAFTSSLFSYDKVQYLSYGASVPGELDLLVIKDGSGTILNSLPIKAVDCTKYTPYIVTFVNRYGVNQEVVFDLVSKESLKVDKKSFNKHILTHENGVLGYDTTSHQTKNYNILGRKSIILNTGYVDESLNSTMEELLQSSAVWITSNGVTNPVNVNTNSLKLKTGINDGLINYQIEFDYSHYTRNTIY